MLDMLEKPVAPTDLLFRSKSGKWKYELWSGGNNGGPTLELNQGMTKIGDTVVLCTLLSCPPDRVTFWEEFCQSLSDHDLEYIGSSVEIADLKSTFINRFTVYRQHLDYVSGDMIPVIDAWDALMAALLDPSKHTKIEDANLFRHS